MLFQDNIYYIYLYMFKSKIKILQQNQLKIIIKSLYVHIKLQKVAYFFMPVFVLNGATCKKKKT